MVNRPGGVALKCVGEEKSVGEEKWVVEKDGRETKCRTELPWRQGQREGCEGCAVCQHADEILLVRVTAGQTERGAVSDSNEVWTGRCKGREVEAEV